MNFRRWAVGVGASILAGYALMVTAQTVGPTDRLAVIPPAIEGTAQDDAAIPATQQTPAQRSGRCGDGFCAGGETASTCRLDCPGIPGVCGTANGTSQSVYPSGGPACASGIQADVDTAGTDGAFNWNCVGTTGGSTSNCSATTNVNGQCGAANGTTTFPAPSGSAACATGTFFGVDTTAADGTYNWRCDGAGTGSSPSCTATRAAASNGVCGGANGGTVNPQPSGSAACAAGAFVDMADTAGQYRWNCSGTGGGADASCSANIGSGVIVGTCGAANNTNTASHPTGAAACSQGTFTDTADTTSNWNWRCAGSSTANCTSNRPINAVCGSGAGQSVSAQPTNAAACSVGPFNDVADTATDFQWQCLGVNGGTSRTCLASKSTVVSGLCGAANRQGTASYPAGGHCASGSVSATDTAGTDGIFNWNCLGSGGGSNDTCSAPKSTAGACGSANGTARTSDPISSQACSAGLYSDLTTAPNYAWNCRGLNGGAIASCSATRAASNGVCGTGNNSTTSQQWSGTAACSSGVFNDLPDPAGTWRWECLGTNGGTSQTCAAPQGAAAAAFIPEKVSVGSSHLCAVMKNGTVKCWGQNATYGNGGQGSTTPAFLLDPTTVPGLAGVTKIETSGFHNAVLLNNGSVRTWGNNTNGQMGTGDTNPVFSPTTPLGLASGVVDVSTGFLSTCAVMSNGTVRCSGNALSIGLRDQCPSNTCLTPTLVPGITNAVRFMDSDDHVVLRADGSTVYLENVVAQDPPMQGASDTGTGGGAEFGVFSDGLKLRCYHNYEGTCANVPEGGFATHAPIYPVTGMGTATGADGSGNSLCAVRSDRSAWCWGRNDNGWLAVNRPELVVTMPAQVQGIPSVDVIIRDESGGVNCSYVSEGRNVYCWGKNSQYQHSNGSTVPSSRPVLITY